jgi:hypothetical protein
MSDDKNLEKIYIESRKRPRFFEFMDSIQKEKNILTEGLITSYPVSSVMAMLHRKYNSITTFLETEVINSNKGNRNNSTVSLYINKKDDTVAFRNELTQKLLTYGYMLASIKPYNDDEVGFHIEPKFPFIVDPKYLKNKKFYHTTHIDFIHKIKKNGLVPKASQTKFNHDGNRIYIMATDNKIIMDALKVTLARDKNWEPDDMVILEIDVTGMTLYIDPNFDDTNSYTSLFTFENVSPSKILNINQF